MENVSIVNDDAVETGGPYGLQSVFLWCRFQPHHTVPVSLKCSSNTLSTVVSAYLCFLLLLQQMWSSPGTITGLPCSELLNCESQFSHLAKSPKFAAETCRSNGAHTSEIIQKPGAAVGWSAFFPSASAAESPSKTQDASERCSTISD